MSQTKLELTILMPCLDEAETVAICVKKALGFLEKSGIAGEVLIADNGSTDGSQELAIRAGARVASIPQKGYGAAIIGGIAAANGRYIIMGDADDSYDFSSLGVYVDRLRQGYQLVMGDRFAGGIMPGAMPPLHRYLGNPVLSFIGRLLFRSPLGDFHCGLRGFDRASILSLNLSSPGMEFASEMIVKATLRELRITDVPTVLHPDGRSRPPHLRSWRDGWRHLRFLLMMSPRWLMLYPGIALFTAGALLSAIILASPLTIGGISLDIHTMLYAAGASILGLQLILFAILSRSVGLLKGILPPTPSFAKVLRLFTLERGLISGGVVVVLGLGLGIYSLDIWFNARLSSLEPRDIMRIVIPSVTLMVMGAEVLFASFMLSFIDAPTDAVNPLPH